jgi:UDP-glucose 4-epimerase
MSKKHFQRINSMFSSFHLAAQKNVRESLKNPLHDAEINIQGSLGLISLSQKFGVKKFIFSSTGGAMYGDVRTLPTKEDTAPHPTTPYGIAKYTVEQYLEVFAKEYGLKSAILRYANVYGPRQDPEGEAGVISIFCDAIQHGEPMTIFGDGKQTRDYVYVSDVVQANILAMQRALPGPINIGTGVQTSVLKLAETLKKVSGKRTKVKHRAAISAEVRKSALDVKLAKRVLGWKPTVSLLDGLVKTWEDQA